jgi:peptidoglycan LD-endopeptidase LytH
MRVVWGGLGLITALLVMFLLTVRWEAPDNVQHLEVLPETLAESEAETRTVIAEPGALRGMIVPVAGVRRDQLYDRWGDPRGGGARAHVGLDIMAANGTPVLAAADGRIEKLYYSNGGGGITIYQRSSDPRWMFYYAHLAAYAPGLREGQRVSAGDHIGYVGDTGNAGAGNDHLHFGITHLNRGERWWQGTPVNPHPVLAGQAAAR